MGPPSGLQAVTSLAADPRSSAILYATLSDGQVLRSADGARSWSAIGKMPGTFPVDLTPDPFAARVLYAGLSFQQISSGVFRSDDGGGTWQRRSQGYTAQDTFTVSVAPGEAEQVWTAAGTQIFRSGNGGRRWARTAWPGLSVPLTPSTLAVASGSTAFVLTSIPGAPNEKFLWRTEDAGASWRPGAVVSRLAFPVPAPSEVSTLYALKYTVGPFVLVDLLRTTNGGASWETPAARVLLGLGCGIGSLAVAPSTSSVLYLTGAAGGSSCQNPAAWVLRSQDGGATWTNAGAGLPPGLITQVSVDPNDPGVLYAGYGPYFPSHAEGVWKSTDGGATWKRAGTGLAGQMVAALLATSAPGRVYAALTDGRVFRTEDGGESWEDVSTGLLASQVHNLAADPFNPGRVYAATTSGVWVLEETSPVDLTPDPGT